MRTLSFALLCASCFGAADADSPLISAVKAGDRAEVAALLQQRVDVNADEADGTTALMWAARNPFGNEHFPLSDLLIRAGADVKAANRYGITALYLACQNGNAPLIDKLLQAGADANAASTEGETALMTAARTGVVEAVEVLLGHGAQIDARETWHGETALMWAVAEGHAEMARYLIAHGADVNAHSSQPLGAADHFRAAREMASAGRPDAAAVRRPARLPRLRPSSGGKKRGRERGRSYRNQSGFDRHHQRPLRCCGLLARKRGGSESGRRNRANGPVLGCGFSHHAARQSPRAEGNG